MESCRVFIQFQDKPSARLTFVSAKVSKTIVIRKTRQLLSANLINRRNNTLLTESCLKQLRMTFPSIIFLTELKLDNI